MEWETSTKYNFGIDGRLWNEKIDFSVDFFRNKTTDIFQRRESVPFESGLYSTLPFANIGEMTSWGVDGHASYHQKINDDINFTVRGNFTLARNNVNNWEQAGVRYPYQSWSGVPYGIMRGLISEGLFKDEDDIQSSPEQTFMTDVRPGDIKYKDVNGDGVINDDDVVPLSYSNIPNSNMELRLSLTTRISELMRSLKCARCRVFLGWKWLLSFCMGVYRQHT